MKRLTVALLLCAALPAQTPNPLPAVAVDLKSKVKIPLRLPEQLPDLGQASDPVYAVVERADARAYSIILGFTPDCNGASVCRLGSLTGGTASRKPLAGKAVRLHHGITGRYVEGKCGANCADSVITWRQGKYEYSAGVKGGSLEDVRALANACLIVSGQVK